MNYNLLYQCVFCLAFLNFFIYWIDLFFFSFSSNVSNSFQRKKKFLKWLPISSFKKSLNQRLASIDITKFIISLTLWCSLTLLIIFRYIQSNHFPLSNFYEALIFLTWSLVTLNFLILFEPFNYNKIGGSAFHIFTSTPKKKPFLSRVSGEKTQNSRINFFFQILPLQIKNNLAPKIFKEVILILREKQERITAISTSFFNQNNTLEKKKSIDVLHMEKEPKKFDFIQNQFQLYNFRKNHFSNYEHSRFKNVALQPITSLNVREWQPTNRKFLNYSTEFSTNLQFFTLLKEIIKIPSEYYKKFENISQEKKKLASQPSDLITHSLKEIKSSQFTDEQKKKEQEKKKQEKKIYGGILAPCILFILAFAQFNLSSEFTPLVPALKSNWLFMHVSIMICSYTTFIVGGLISLILLIQIFFFSRSNTFYGPKELPIDKFGIDNISTILPQGLIVPKLSSLDYYNFIFSNIPNREILKKETRLKIKENSAFSARQLSSFTNLQTTLIFQWKNKRENITCSSIKTTAWQQLQNKTKQLEFSIAKKKKGGDFNITLDNLSYRMFGIGFPLFTLGLLSGAVWANSAWGSYWSWDIKEVGSFIHWLVLTFYFHCRYKNYITFSHWIGFLSLIVLFFNFFGVSLGIYGSSLHAYS